MYHCIACFVSVSCLSSMFFFRSVDGPFAARQGSGKAKLTGKSCHGNGDFPLHGEMIGGFDHIHI